jgi:hypothetical protein
LFLIVSARCRFAGDRWISAFRQNSAGSPLRSGRSCATLTPRGSFDCIAAARTTIRVSFTVALAFGPSLPALHCAPAASSFKGSFVRHSPCERNNQTLFKRGAFYGEAEIH